MKELEALTYEKRPGRERHLLPRGHLPPTGGKATVLAAYALPAFPGAVHLCGVAEATALGRGLAVAAGLAEGLPVGFVPEKNRIAAMRYNVIDYSGDADLLALRLAGKWVSPEEPQQALRQR